MPGSHRFCQCPAEFLSGSAQGPVHRLHSASQTPGDLSIGAAVQQKLQTGQLIFREFRLHAVAAVPALFLPDHDLLWFVLAGRRYIPPPHPAER